LAPALYWPRDALLVVDRAAKARNTGPPCPRAGAGVSACILAAIVHIDGVVITSNVGPVRATRSTKHAGDHSRILPLRRIVAQRRRRWRYAHVGCALRQGDRHRKHQAKAGDSKRLPHRISSLPPPCSVAPGPFPAIRRIAAIVLARGSEVGLQPFDGLRGATSSPLISSPTTAMMPIRRVIELGPVRFTSDQVGSLLRTSLKSREGAIIRQWTAFQTALSEWQTHRERTLKRIVRLEAGERTS
jgi:hypothetical protein